MLFIIFTCKTFYLIISLLVEYALFQEKIKPNIDWAFYPEGGSMQDARLF